MASLTGTKIKDTYDSLLKVSDNGALGASAKQITDGLGNSSGVYLGTSGNVGIGTSSPAVNLHINDANGGILRLQRDDTAVAGNDSLGALEFYSNDATDAGVKAKIDTISLDSTPDGILRFHTYNEVAASLSERMRIDNSGNVLIGTQSSSGFPLEVYGGTGDGVKIKAGNSSNDDSLLITDNSDTTLFKVDGGGNVKINNGVLQLVDSNKLITTNGSNIRIWQRSAADIEFITADIERARITSGGDVQTQGTIQNNNFGVPLIETTAQFTIGSGGTYTLGSFSGVVIVNNRSQGSTEIFVLGGGGTSSLGNSSGSTGTWTFSNPNYIFTNNLGSTQVYSFMLLKTRPAV